MPERIQLRRAKGWRKPPNTVVVARPTQWGNPYRVGYAGVKDRQQAVDRYRAWCKEWEGLAYPMIRRDLRGKNLACWCPLEDADGNRVPCHADVLLEIANS